MGRYDREEAPLEPAGNAKDEEIARLIEEGRQRDLKQAAADARFEQMERDVSRRFAENQRNTPPVDEMFAAQQELQIKDEELLDPSTAPGAIRRIAEHQAKRIAAEQDTRYGGVIGNVAGDVFDLKMDKMSNREYFEDLEPLIREYFQDNPRDLHVSGKIDEVYERLVGKNYEALRERHGNPVDEGGEGSDVSASKSRYRQQSRVVDAPVRTASASGRIDRGGKKAVVLDKAREETRLLFEGLGVEMSPEEWDDIETGKKYPKKFAADIQVGISKANVDYE